MKREPETLSEFLDAGGFVMYNWSSDRRTEASVIAAVKHFVSTYHRKPVLVVCHKSRLIKTRAVEVREAMPGEPKPGPLQIFVQ